MKFHIRRGEPPIEIETIEALVAWLRAHQTRDHEIYGVMITLPNSYSGGAPQLWTVDNQQFTNMGNS